MDGFNWRIKSNGNVEASEGSKDVACLGECWEYCGHWRTQALGYWQLHVLQDPPVKIIRKTNEMNGPYQQMRQNRGICLIWENTIQERQRKSVDSLHNRATNNYKNTTTADMTKVSTLYPLSQHIMLALPHRHDKTKVSMTQHSMMALLQQAWQDYSFYNSLHHNGPTTASMTRLKFLWVNISWWPHHKAMTRLKFLCLKISWWPYHSKDEKTKVSTTQHIIMALSQQAWQD